MNRVAIDDMVFVQAANNHIMGAKDGKMFFHASYEEPLTEDELLEYVKNVINLMEQEDWEE